MFSIIINPNKDLKSLLSNEYRSWCVIIHFHFRLLKIIWIINYFRNEALDVLIEKLMRDEDYGNFLSTA